MVHIAHGQSSAVVADGMMHSPATHLVAQCHHTSVLGDFKVEDLKVEMTLVLCLVRQPHACEPPHAWRRALGEHPLPYILCPRRGVAAFEKLGVKVGRVNIAVPTLVPPSSRFRADWPALA